MKACGCCIFVFDCARSSRMIHNKLDALASQELSFLLGPEDEVSAPFLFFSFVSHLICKMMFSVCVTRDQFEHIMV